MSLRAQRSEAKRSGASLARELPVGVIGQKPTAYLENEAF